MKQRRSRRDRIAAEEHLDARELAAGDEAERERFRAGDGTVKPRLGRRSGDVVLLERRAHLDRLAISVAGVESGDIGFGELGCLGELGLEPVDDRGAVAVEHPQREAERPHVLAAQRLLVAETERLHRIKGQLRDVEMDHLPFRQATVLKRTLLVTGLGEVARGELALVGDDQPAFAQGLGIHLERRGVHRDQHIGLVPGGLDRGRSEIDLEGGDAKGRALRRANLRREVGEGREVVAGKRGRQRELAAGQLHAVAAVAGKADDDRFLRRMRGGFLVGEEVGGGGHKRVL